MYAWNTLRFLLVGAALALHANAATIRIDAGLNGIAYSPNSVTAAVGDTLEFHFHPLNHSVVMGDFNNPCAPAAAGGFFSGFMPVTSGEGPSIFQVTVNSTSPIFFYCAQNAGSHCKIGMSAVVNPTAGLTLAAYQKAAQSVSTATSPTAPFGGLVVANSASSSTTPAGTSTAACTPTSGSSSGGGYRRNVGCSSNGAPPLAASNVGGLLAAVGFAALMV